MQKPRQFTDLDVPSLPPPLPPRRKPQHADEDFSPARADCILTRAILQDVLGFEVGSFPGHYAVAFTHKSAAHELQRPSYERLEFLGDSVLNLITARYLYERYPDKDEGFLTKMRTRLTRSSTLADLSKHLRLERFVWMYGRAMAQGFNKNEKIMEDVFEALVGAIYLDVGLLAAKQFFIHLIETHIDFTALLEDTNYKCILMRLMHSRGLPLPVYVSTKVNDGAFETTVMIEGKQGVGRHSTKKGAEQCAAYDVLVQHHVPITPAPGLCPHA